MAETIVFSEHERKSKSDDSNEMCALRSLVENGSLKLEGVFKERNAAPKFLGLESSENAFVSSYYIGASWLKENELAVIVEPKIASIDYLKMFSAALSISTEKESRYFSTYYGIEFGKSEIEVPSELNMNIITPLILIHYISVLKNLAKHGLKKDYIYIEKNLQSKIKGHLVFHKHLRKNVIGKREDRAYCAFQEYTDDIPENRLLKKALIFAKNAIANSESLKNHSIYEPLTLAINKLLSDFSNVSDKIEIYEVKSLRANKLFSEYKEAIRLAKMILRKYDYSLQKTEETESKTLPFWIDMPRLYEMYVYAWLKENVKDDEILFQAAGYGETAADYVLRRSGMILDAKYKPRYKNSNAGIIDDIREMSGYARDEKILRKFENPQAEKVPCVILYPSSFEEMEKFGGEEAELERTKQADERIFGDVFERKVDIKRVRAYRDFYKMRVDVPRL